MSFKWVDEASEVCATGTEFLVEKVEVGEINTGRDIVNVAE